MDNQQKSPSFFKHLRDILILPFSAIIIIPYSIYTGEQGFLPDNMPIKVLACICILIGVLLFAFTLFLFDSKGKGTLAPWSPTKKLVVSGPYKYCRNPMISGVLSVLIGESFLFHSSNILIWAASFFIINTLYFLIYEEPSLTERFGEEYRHYKKEVPRWIPRLKPYKQ